MWVEGVSLQIHGLRIGLRATAPGVVERALVRLPVKGTPTRTPVVDHLFSFVAGGDGPRPGVRRFHVGYLGAARFARALREEEVFEQFETDAEALIATHAKDRIFVHAGVVGIEGRAVLVCGRSLAGKTTLVAELVRRGATYFSDEFAVLDEKGRVWPFPRLLGIRTPEGDRERVSAEALGGVAARAPLPIGAILFATFRAQARWRPRSLSPAQAILELLRHTVGTRSDPARALRTLSAASRTATFRLAGRRGDVAGFVEEVTGPSGMLARSSGGGARRRSAKARVR